MSEVRHITMYISATDRTQITEITGDKAFNGAVGYLSTWNMSFPVLELYNNSSSSDGTIELSAVYRKEPGGDVGYVIAAVWHFDHEGPKAGYFGFHS